MRWIHRDKRPHNSRIRKFHRWKKSVFKKSFQALSDKIDRDILSMVKINKVDKVE